MARLFGAAILMVLLVEVGSTACSSETARNPQHMGEETRQQTGSRENTVAPETTSKGEPSRKSTVGGGITEVMGASASWVYVALGDSLAVGVGAHRGYVARYADHVEVDTGASVKVVNLGQSGQTSSQLFNSLRNDQSVRRKVRAARIITFNTGINDLGRAGEAYENGTCGGADNQQCLRAAVERIKGNWDAILSELVGLRSTDKALIRTAGIGYTPQVDEVFKPYLHEVNHHITTTAAENDIPYAQPYLDKGHINPDGVHPSDNGYRIIADRLRELGYSPLAANVKTTR